LLVKARSRPVEGHDNRRLPRWIGTDIVTHYLPLEQTSLGGIRHDGRVAGDKYRVKLGMIVMSAERIGARPWELRKVRSCRRPSSACSYLVYDQHAAVEKLHCSFPIQFITMAKRLSVNCLRRLQQHTRRSFSSTIRPQTDGVFRALTENRIQTPWIDALREKERGGHDPTKPSGKSETPNDRDLSPKRMSDSYHSVVLPLAREPWLLDTYANSSGHIRLGTLFMDLDALSTPLREARPRSLD
jgi:hypothetical protein